MGAYEINDQLLTNEEKKELTINKDQQTISRKKEVFRKFISNPIAVLGAVTLLLIIVFSLIGESLTSFTASEQVKEATNLPPSSEHWFGTDDLGRDIWARTWAGGKISLTVGLVAAALDIGLGVLIGGFSGYVRGRNRLGTLIDEWIIRGIEVLYGIPYLLIVILLLIVMKPGLFTIIIALALTGWIGMARLIRAQVLVLKAKRICYRSRAIRYTSYENYIWAFNSKLNRDYYRKFIIYNSSSYFLRIIFKFYRTWSTITSSELGHDDERCTRDVTKRRMVATFLPGNHDCTHHVRI